MTIGILKESATEKRVAMLPGEVAVLKKLGVDIVVEKGAGERAFVSDKEYVSAGASTAERKDLISLSSLLLSVNAIPDADLDSLNEGQITISVVNPAENSVWLEKARIRGITVLALDLVPRTTRAQSMDVLSSMATVAGYRAVLAAASILPKFFPMFMSAAGTIKPAKVLILGAGVAGLQAVATARKLGAVVEVFDVRSAVKEEVKSLGGKFIEVEGAKEDAAAGGYAVEQSDDFKRKQQELIQKKAEESDVIIATAQIPGRKAPLLVVRETVMKMKPGSVIVDIAASSGGNCELTVNGQTRIVNGVTIIGKSDFPSDMPFDSSKMFGSNIVNLLKVIIDKNGKPVLDMNDEIIAGTTAVHNKEYISLRAKQILGIN
ncbi:MAG TPA: Re/Si-specific NAD(P)(+) transhydrogenase subunit alpha [Bacteroidales bacterium]|jgi:NAD(P) transhydrogenase subunit alpha|nr:Re/Si-specific NAD(P)(+) transhydrogenase subunit alpha [Bacteroidales bacterium]